MVWSATLNMQLGALRDQQQLQENYFLKMFVRSKLWKVADPLKQHKEPKVRARRARLGSERGCHEAGWCQPPRARSLEPCVVKCLKRGGACEIGGAPTRRQMHQVMRGPPRLVSMRGGHRVPWCLPPREPTRQPSQPGLLQAQAQGALGDDGPKTAQAATSETQAPSPGV